jgi:hypothetical protein
MKILSRLLLISSMLGASALCAMCQTVNVQDRKAIPASESASRTTADETFDLNIDERRFTRENFEASTSVSTDGDAGLNLRVGVALAASRIDALLRNVRGRVRFHGTLDRVLERIGNRRAQSPPPSPR